MIKSRKLNVRLFLKFYEHSEKLHSEKLRKDWQFSNNLSDIAISNVVILRSTHCIALTYCQTENADFILHYRFKKYKFYVTELYQRARYPVVSALHWVELNMVILKIEIPDNISPRLGTEVLSLTQNQIYSSTNQSTEIDLKLPNSVFINGIVLSHDSYPTCDKIEIGKMNTIHLNINWSS